jgi:hypothetical protein
MSCRRAAITVLAPRRAGETGPPAVTAAIGDMPIE